MKYGKRYIGMLIIAALIMAMLSGCRKSPVLEQKIYTSSAQELDPDQQAEDRDEDSDDETQGNDKVDENAQNADDSAATEGVASADGTGTGADTQYNKNGNDDLSAQGSGSSEGSEEGLTDNSAEGNADGNNSEDGEGSNIKNDSDASASGISENDGEEREITEDADIVAAPGAAAQIVEMVAGSGHLVASSQSFTSNTYAKQFSDYSSVKALWTGTGADHGVTVSKLIDIEELDTVFYITGEGLTSSQVDKLTDAGINCIALPQLTSTSNLIEAVDAVAEAFDKATGGDSKKVAAKYEKWIDQVQSDVGGGDSSYYTLYVSEWDDDVTYQLKGDYSALPSSAGVSSSGQGSGVALVPAGDAVLLMNEVLEWANVENQSQQASAGDHDGFYATPMFNQFNPTFSGGDGDYIYKKDSDHGSQYDNFVSVNKSGSYVSLGSSQFKYLIVGSSETKSAIEDSWFWEAKGTASGGSPIINVDGGYYNDELDIMLYGEIKDDYEICVNPSGVGDWAGGSIESPLEGYWISYIYDNGISKSKLKSAIKSFYNTFYGISLSDSQISSMI
ncbi:hypothetical protein [Eubacterium oxidoreducens]|uniref:Uncharacterized protein n=1 Tax=Eubacterium oxidoreducens TaxID=1732 RepID=A0A1G6A029_EUBOX|nr:hypothetical protein [Eubacterium oxidoreducens]SDB01767.1 hypothetical protein SAMN02910417_00069 [Eubacterium oxidoreducens]